MGAWSRACAFLTLENSKELLQQADAIMKNHLVLSNHEIPCDLALENGGKNAASDGAGPYQRRRPGFGRKRAQFAFQPSTSQSFSNVGPTLSTDQLQDPVEFFLAYEKLENAEKELKKLRGETSIEQTQHHQSMTEQRRRPGILGKTVSYKHYCPAAPSDNVLTFVYTQEEKNEVIIPSVSNDMPSLGSNSSMLAKDTDQHGTLREMETAASELTTVTQGKGSISELENRVGNLLNVLLSTHKDLDAGEMDTLLKEHLHIKLINLGKLCLPDLDGVHGMNNYKTSQEKLPRPRKVLSDLQLTIKKSISGKTPVKNQQNFGSPRCPQMSPTPPKSPFALMPMLQRHISQMGSLRDPFSFTPIVDVSSSECSFPARSVDRWAISSPLCTDQVDTQTLSANGVPTPGKIDGKRLGFDGKLQCPQLEGDNTVVNNTSSEKLPAENSSSPIDSPVNDNFNKFLRDMNVMSDGSDSNSQNEEDTPQEVSVSQGTALGLGSLSMENRHFSGNQLEQSGPVEGHVPIDDHLENTDILQERSNEELKGPSRKASSKLTKKKVPPCRQSLAGAGTLWKSGVRRSIRIKSRPLEYWRGERFLYGRIHDSLATVIGVKYASPSKGGEDSVLKVKSYVPDEYAELVEKAALY